MHLWTRCRAWTTTTALTLGLSVSPLVAEQTHAPQDTRPVSNPATTFADSLSLTSRKDPIHIRSHDLEYFHEEKRTQFRGNVVVVQGDMILKSDMLTVTWEGATLTPTASKTTRQQIKQLIAEGHVEITAEKWRATSRKTVFNEAKRTVTLSGNAIVQEGTNKITGEVITIYLDEKRSVVEGGEGKRQVQMILIPQ